MSRPLNNEELTRRTDDIQTEVVKLQRSLREAEGHIATLSALVRDMIASPAGIMLPEQQQRREQLLNSLPKRI